MFDDGAAQMRAHLTACGLAWLKKPAPQSRLWHHVSAAFDQQAPGKVLIWSGCGDDWEDDVERVLESALLEPGPAPCARCLKRA